MRHLACILLMGLALLAVYRGGEMRLHNLEVRAVHPDEGEQTWTFARNFLYGDYKYDPNGSHGAILYYWPFLFLDESDIPTFDVKDLRKTLFPVYPVSALCIFLVAAVSLRKTNKGAASKSAIPAIAAGTFAALLFAFSSLSQIYSTYFVQEVFFALFSIFFACSFYYFWRNPNLWLAAALGISTGLLQATKETSVFVYAASVLACMIVFALKPKEERLASAAVFRDAKAFHWIKVFLMFSIPAFLIYAAFNSSFGANWRGVWDGIASYFIHYFDKSSNPLHSKEFLYYFKLLAGQKREYIFFGETGIFAFAILGTVLAFARRNDAARFVALFAWISLLAMSAIGYKMPWLMLSPLYALCIVGGIGMAQVFTLSFRPLWASLVLRILLFSGALWLFGFQMRLAQTASAKFPSDPRNIFLYVHTLKNSEGLVKRVRDVNRAMDGDLKVLIAMKNSPWPLPWQFARAGSTPAIVRDREKLGDISPYSVIVYDPEFDDVFNGRFDDAIWLEEYFGLRENLLLRVLVKRDLFEKSIQQSPNN